MARGWARLGSLLCTLTRHCRYTPPMTAGSSTSLPVLYCHWTQTYMREPLRFNTYMYPFFLHFLLPFLLLYLTHLFFSPPFLLLISLLCLSLTLVSSLSLPLFPSLPFRPLPLLCSFPPYSAPFSCILPRCGLLVLRCWYTYEDIKRLNWSWLPSESWTILTSTTSTTSTVTLGRQVNTWIL